MSELFLTVLNMSLTASYVIIFVILIRLLLKKAPKVISYVLWGVVAFRLIIPFSFESMFSLMPQNSNPVPIPHDIIYQQSPQINSGIEVVDSFVSQSLPAPIIGASVNPLQIFVEIGAYIWVLGIIALLIYSLVSILILKSRLKSAQLVEKDIFEAKNLKTSFVLGLFCPKIYIPSGLSAEEKSYIILHEQTHIRRFDHLVKMVAFLILCVHWFNPLVWVAFLLMSADMEMSCDERVLKEMGSKIKQAYSTSLLSLATGRRLINGSPLAFGEGNVKGRIKNILNFKKPAALVMVVSIILVAALVIGFTSNRPSVDDSSATSTTTPSEDMELITKADLGRDGHEESIYLDKTQMESTHDITLRVLDSSGNEIWNESANTSHAGWNSLFLFEQDGEYYLLRYNPTMYQGYSTYVYTLFTLESGKEKVYRTNTLEFDINGTKELDVSKMISFADEVNALLGKSILLMSTKDGVYSFGPSAEPFYERYSWLDAMPKLYAVGDDLEMRLKKYSDYAVSNRKISEGKVFIVTESEVISAKEAALSYYENTVFKGRVTNIVQIKDSSEFISAVITYRIKDVVVAFNVTMSDNAKRNIVLTKEKGGDWEVIKEGV